jgi:hypothetical protein
MIQTIHEITDPFDVKTPLVARYNEGLYDGMNK